jgi:N-acetyl-alpha-D-muramate 1-phosphate uridylyltransferase
MPHINSPFRGLGGGKGMIFAAGLGSRLKPWTDHHPKALAVVNGKTLLQRNIEYLKKYNIHEVIVNVHHFADQIIEVIEKNKGWGSSVTISDETDMILETGGGLKKTEWYFSDVADFVLMNVDILTDMNLSMMIQQHQAFQPIATLGVSERTSSRYLLFDEKNILSGWENTKTEEKKIVRGAETLFRKAFSGIHVISTSIFPLIKQEGKFSMIDLYLEIAKTKNIITHDHSGAKLIDVGKPESILAAEKLFD